MDLYWTFFQVHQKVILKLTDLYLLIDGIDRHFIFSKIKISLFMFFLCWILLAFFSTFVMVKSFLWAIHSVLKVNLNEKSSSGQKTITAWKGRPYRSKTTMNQNQCTYSDVSIKNIDILPNWQYIANTADLAQEQYS